MYHSVIQRAALGRVGKIGALYDVRSESFLADTIFASKVDAEVDTTTLGKAEIELVMSDNIQEKFKKLDVEAELQVSVMAGLVNLSGSGSYLGEERKSARAHSMSLLYKLRTVHEEIMLRQNKEKIDQDIFTYPDSNATHTVVGIDWGAVCLVTCEYENTADENITEVEGELKAALNKLKGTFDLGGAAKAAYDDKDTINHEKFSFRCKTDVSDLDNDLPVNFEGAVELARSVPSLVKGTNNGKGVPLVYKLKPLEDVIKICGLQIQLHIIYKSIDVDIILRCAQVVQGITKKKQALYDIQSDLHDNAEYVASESLTRIDDILDKFNVQESQFKARLQDVVKRVRSGSTEVSEIDALLSKELPETFSESIFNDQLRKFQSDVKKIKSIKTWKKKGVIYIGKTDEFNVDDIEQKYIYIYYKPSVKNEKGELEDKNRDFFLRLQKRHAQDDRYKFVAVDQDLRHDLWSASGNKVAIHSFVNGVHTSDDLYAKEVKEKEMCLVQLNPTCTYQQNRPSKRAHVLLRCPNHAFFETGLCTGETVTWKCSQCQEMVLYGIDTRYFYCRCGVSDPTMSLWRCNEKDHGTQYVKYQDDILTEELSNHHPIKETNILILGDIGVGKSTWINGFFNYLNFTCIEEAMNARKFHVLIPSSFTFIQNGEAKAIRSGASDSNENIEPGKSTTKQPRSYVFDAEGEIIRLIDTPGIGDFEGPQQDRINFDNILSYLSNYEEIHAICILLKPNNCRLTVMFRFCIQELLAHLHSTAKHNIVFCFTNARATFYEPGDILPALNRELREKKVGIQATSHNFFCFDNETFRFLACVKNGVEFSQRDINTYAESWNKSVEETKRLFHYINSMRPHKIRNTVNMNEARSNLVAMANIAKIIQQNVQEGNEAKELMEEERIIKKTIAKYGSFLKTNALIPYNDAVGDYLDMCIEQERHKSSRIRDNALLSSMEDMKRQYEHESRILDKAIGTTSGENIQTAEEVMKLRDELFRLKHTGRTFQDLFSGFSISHAAQNSVFKEKTVQVQRNSRLLGTPDYS